MRAYPTVIATTAVAALLLLSSMAGPTPTTADAQSCSTFTNPHTGQTVDPASWNTSNMVDLTGDWSGSLTLRTKFDFCHAGGAPSGLGHCGTIASPGYLLSWYEPNSNWDCIVVCQSMVSAPAMASDGSNAVEVEYGNCSTKNGNSGRTYKVKISCNASVEGLSGSSYSWHDPSTYSTHLQSSMACGVRQTKCPAFTNPHTGKTVNAAMWSTKNLVDLTGDWSGSLTLRTKFDWCQAGSAPTGLGHCSTIASPGYLLSWYDDSQMGAADVTTRRASAVSSGDYSCIVVCQTMSSAPAMASDGSNAVEVQYGGCSTKNGNSGRTYKVKISCNASVAGLSGSSYSWHDPSTYSTHLQSSMACGGDE